MTDADDSIEIEEGYVAPEDAEAFDDADDSLDDVDTDAPFTFVDEEDEA